MTRYTITTKLSEEYRKRADEILGITEEVPEPNELEVNYSRLCKENCELLKKIKVDKMKEWEEFDNMFDHKGILKVKDEMA